MATINHELKYRCNDDCLQSGCPSHIAKLQVQTTSDYYTFDNGHGSIHHFERGELEAFIKLLKGIDRLDTIIVNSL